MSGFHWLVSYPKSGSTWLRLMLRSLSLGGAPVDFRAKEGFAPAASRRDNFDAWLDAQSSDLTPDEAESLRPRLYEAEAQAASGPLLRMVYDARALTRTGEPVFPSSLTLAVVYLVRDPRDVAVSLAHQMRRSLDETIDFMGRPDAALSGSRRVGTVQLRQRLLPWSAHVESWLDAPPTPLLLRYEDMLADPAAELERVACHLGWTPSPDAVDGAVAATRFDRLRELEEQQGFRQGAPDNARFFRRGVAGGWREALSAPQAARIEREHAAVMTRLGYG